MLDEDVSIAVDDTNSSIGGGLKGLVMRAIFLGLLGHQAHVGNGSHGGRVKGSMLSAKFNRSLINSCIGAVGNNGEGVLALTPCIPHLARVTNHGRHGGVNDDVAGHMKVRDPSVGIHHGQRRPLVVTGLKVGFDLLVLFLRKGLNLGKKVSDSIVEIDTKLVEKRFMFFDQLLEVCTHALAEDDRVRDLHHGGLHVQGKEESLLPCVGDLMIEKRGESLQAHDAGIKNLPGKKRRCGFENASATVGIDKLDLESSGALSRDGLLPITKISCGHGCDVRLGILRPRAH